MMNMNEIKQKCSKSGNFSVFGASDKFFVRNKFEWTHTVHAADYDIYL